MVVAQARYFKVRGKVKFKNRNDVTIIVFETTGSAMLINNLIKTF